MNLYMEMEHPGKTEPEWSTQRYSVVKLLNLKEFFGKARKKNRVINGSEIRQASE